MSAQNENCKYTIVPIMFGFFVMGFCDIVGFTSDYVQHSFDWSPMVTGFVPSMVFIWFLFLGIPIGGLMNRWGRKRTVLLSMAVTVVGMILPLVAYNGVTCMIAYALLGIGNAILQVSLNPLLSNVVTEERLLTSTLTLGQVIKALSSLLGPEIVLISTLYFGDEHWYYCFPILGAITLVSALWLSATPIRREAISADGDISMCDSFVLLKNRVLLMLFLGVFFIVGVDVAVNFISSKLMIIRFDWEIAQSKIAPQIYFLSRTIGALLGAVALAHISATKYFRVNIVACLLALIVLMATQNHITNLVCIGAVGFFTSSIFSIIYSLALQNSPDKANQISGLMITAIAGGGVVTPIIGVAISQAGIAGGIGVVVVCALYLMWCAFNNKIRQ